MTRTILVTDYDFPNLDVERRILDDHGIELASAQAKTPEAVIDAARDVDADALLVQYAPISAEVLQTTDVTAVGRYGIGVDTIDLDAAAAEGVTVVNVPDYCDDEVPTHAIALLFACVRKVSMYDAAIDDGTWDWTMGRPIDRFGGSTLGFVGFGSQARAVAERLSGFDLETLAFDPYQSADDIAEVGAEAVDLDELLSRSDFVSVHTPLTDETRHLLDADAFDTMQDGAVLINTARGAVIDSDALEDALDDGTVASAGLDVLPEEPPGESPLVGRDDVTLTPHMAWYSEESFADLRETVTTDLVRILDDEAPENAVVDPVRA